MAKDWTGNKKSTFVTLGASNHTDKERQKEDYYATDKYDSKGVIRSIKGYVWRSKPWEEPNDSTLVTTTVIGLGWHNFKYVANTHKLDWNKIVVEQLNPKDIGMRSDTNLKRITMPKFYLNYFGKQWREKFNLKEEGVI